MAKLFQFPYRTVAEISLKALLRNLHTLRHMSQREVIPVIKADAYGHGIIPVARCLIQRGSVQALAVATLEEATELRESFPDVTILVLSGFFPHQLEAFVKYRLTPVIHSLNHLKSLEGRTILPEIHLKFDSGMHRLGILPDEVPQTIETLKNLNVKLAGVATHFADSESMTSGFVDNQVVLFDEILDTLRQARVVNTDARIHIANSGGILRQKWDHATAVRPGISLFGVSPNERLVGSGSLVPVLEWKTRVIAVKTIPRGGTVGYNRTFVAKKETRIAVIPVGYADGFVRILGNRGNVLIEGTRCPVVGRVSMDMATVDCTHLPELKEGASVTLIGKNRRDSIGATELGLWADTIAYEVFCGISPRVPRLYLD